MNTFLKYFMFCFVTLAVSQNIFAKKPEFPEKGFVQTEVRDEQGRIRMVVFETNEQKVANAVRFTYEDDQILMQTLDVPASLTSKNITRDDFIQMEKGSLPGLSWLKPAPISIQNSSYGSFSAPTEENLIRYELSAVYRYYYMHYTVGEHGVQNVVTSCWGKYDGEPEYSTEKIKIK
ncbi:MAG: hypothetical protein V1647_01680, partial [Pseudomonadota bacterium]